MPVTRGKPLALLATGEQADLFVRVEEVSVRRARAGGAEVLLDVIDPSGRAAARWSPDERGHALAAGLARGALVKLRATVERPGSPAELAVAGARAVAEEDADELDAVFGALPEEARALAGGSVAFDVETVPRIDPLDLPERERDRFLRGARLEAARAAAPDEPDPDAVGECLGRALALNPLTCRVVSLALARTDGAAELALVAAPEAELAPPARAVEERELLEAFWAVAWRAARLVGFCSRRFDLPVLLSRSALLGVRAATSLLEGRRPQEAPHLDLHETLCGRGGASGPRLSLELAAFAFGIPAKSLGHGSEVGLLVEEERWQELADYNREDARATAALYGRLLGTWL